MRCLKCGIELTDQVGFCSRCGFPTSLPVYATNQDGSTKGNGFAITSFVLGLLGLLLWILAPLGVLSCATGLVLGIVGIKSMKYKGLAIAGIVLCAIFLLASLLAVGPFMIGFMDGMNNYSSY